MAEEVESDDLKKSYLRFKRSPLYKVLASQRDLVKLHQVQDLLSAGLKSTDPEIRARCAAIANDGLVWAYLTSLEKEIDVQKQTNSADADEKHDRPYNVPDFSSEELVMGLMPYMNP